MSLYQLVYISVARQVITDSVLDDILTSAIEKNNAAGITGCLIYNGGVFLQLLEGPQDQVQALFHKIAKDSRHEQIETLYFEPAHHRIFSRWSMSFIELDQIDVDISKTIQAIFKAIEDKQSIAGVSSPLALLKEFSRIELSA